MSAFDVRLLAGTALTLAVATPASAHPGDHHGMSFSELAAHVTSGWHLAMVGAAVALGVGLVAMSARREARARRTSAKNRSDT